VAHPNITRILHSHTNYMRINRGGIRWGGEEGLSALMAKGLDRDHIGGCLYRALAMPTEATIARFLRHALFILSPRHKVIGIHERLGDRVMHQLENVSASFNSDHWNCTRTHAARMANETGMPIKWFFVTDSLDYKQKALAHFGGDTMFTTEVSPYHVNKQQLHWDNLIYRPSPFPNPYERLITTYGAFARLPRDGGCAICSCIDVTDDVALNRPIPTMSTLPMQASGSCSPWRT
jgi:hypothetical protein